MNLVRHSYTVLPEQWCAVLLLRDVREKRLTSILIRGFFQNSVSKSRIGKKRLTVYVMAVSGFVSAQMMSRNSDRCCSTAVFTTVCAFFRMNILKTPHHRMHLMSITAPQIGLRDTDISFGSIIKASADIAATAHSVSSA